MRFMVQTRQKAEQVKAYFRAVIFFKSTTHSTKPQKTQRGADWGGASLGWVKQRTEYCKYAS